MTFQKQIIRTAASVQDFLVNMLGDTTVARAGPPVSELRWYLPELLTILHSNLCSNTHSEAGGYNYSEIQLSN